MKKMKFFLLAVAVALSMSFIGNVNASSQKGPLCQPAPDDLCLTGPGGTQVILDFRNR